MESEELVPSTYGRLDLWVEGVPTGVYVKFCDRCFGLVAAVKMPAHMDWHTRMEVRR